MINLLPHPSPRNRVWRQKSPWFQQDVLPRLKEMVAERLSANRAIGES